MDIAKIQQLVDPMLNATFGKRVTWNEKDDVLYIDTPYLAHPEYGSHYTALHMTIARALGSMGKKCSLQTRFRPPSISQQHTGSTKVIPHVRNIVVVGSGKGGVGKSTVTSLIVKAATLLGAKVGLLDADIYGPNQPMLMGAQNNARLQVTEKNRFIPLMLDGIATVSFGAISDESTPVVWRGPMISSALQQMLMHTNWPELDFLIIDLPPGTGDIQLTTASSVQVAGFVLVTTTQTLAVQEAIKTLSMASKLHLPMLGYVENMTRFICQHCGHEHSIWGNNQPKRLPAELPQLGSFPIEPNLQNDAGKIQFSPNSATGIEAIQIAEALSLTLAKSKQATSNIIAKI